MNAGPITRGEVRQAHDVQVNPQTFEVINQLIRDGFSNTMVGTAIIECEAIIDALDPNDGRVYDQLEAALYCYNDAGWQVACRYNTIGLPEAWVITW